METNTQRDRTRISQLDDAVRHRDGQIIDLTKMMHAAKVGTVVFLNDVIMMFLNDVIMVFLNDVIMVFLNNVGMVFQSDFGIPWISFYLLALLNSYSRVLQVDSTLQLQSMSDELKQSFQHLRTVQTSHRTSLTAMEQEVARIGQEAALAATRGNKTSKHLERFLNPFLKPAFVYASLFNDIECTVCSS